MKARLQVDCTVQSVLLDVKVLKSLSKFTGSKFNVDSSTRNQALMIPCPESILSITPK